MKNPAEGQRRKKKTVKPREEEDRGGSKGDMQSQEDHVTPRETAKGKASVVYGKSKISTGECGGSQHM
jgi:hypothetical protein